MDELKKKLESAQMQEARKFMESQDREDREWHLKQRNQNIEQGVKVCHYPTPDTHHCYGSGSCGFNEPDADDYQMKCACCQGYCGGEDDGEECRCEQIGHLL